MIRLLIEASEVGHWSHACMTTITVLYIKNCKQFIQCCISDRYETAKIKKNDKYALCCTTHMCFGDHHKNLNENRPILSAAKM